MFDMTNIFSAKEVTDAKKLASEAALKLECLLNKDTTKVSQKEEAEEKLAKAVKNLNIKVQEALFAALRGDKPMESAIRAGYWKAYKVRNDVDSLKRQAVTIVETPLKVIDLAALQAFCKCDIGSKPAWIYIVERFNMRYNQMVNRQLGAMDEAEFERSYKLSKEAKDIQMAQILLDGDATPKDPLSKRSVLELLQEVVDAMLFIDNGEGKNSIKVDSRVFVYLDKVLCRDKKDSCGLVLPRTAMMLEKLTKLLNSAINNDGYSIDYEAKED